MKEILEKIEDQAGSIINYSGLPRLPESVIESAKRILKLAEDLFHELKNY